VTLIRRNDDEMMTTTMTTKTKADAVQKPRWKWSGSDEPQSYYCHDDEDTATLTVGEQRRIQLNDFANWCNWSNVDEEKENDMRVVVAAKAIVTAIARGSVAPRIASAFWTTPFGHEPVVEPEYPDEYEESTHVPFMNLTKAERDKKSKQFKFGLCSDCDAGLMDSSEFVISSSHGAFVCNECNDYYVRQSQLPACAGGGCN
jgi:hypothetical protein